MQTNTYAEAHTNTAASAPQSWLRPRRVLATLDSLAAALAFLVAFALLPLRGVEGVSARGVHALTLFLIAFLLLGLLFKDGQYSAGRRFSRMGDTLSLGRSMVTSYLVVMGASYASKGFFLGYGSQSRLVIFSDLVLMFALMWAARLGLRKYQLRLFARGEAVRQVLVVGCGRAAADFVSFLEARPWLGVRCAGSIGVAADGSAALRSEGGTLIRPLGSLLEAERLFLEHRADEFIVALDPADQPLLSTVAQTLRAEGLPFRIVPSLFEYSYQNTRLRGFAELPTIELKVDPLDRVQRTLKRGLDVTVAGAALTLTSPLLLLVALGIRLTSPGPVIFSQERVGRKGEVFRVHKFRTMYRDAEERLAELLDQNEAEGHIFKMKALLALGSCLSSCFSLRLALKDLSGLPRIKNTRPPRATVLDKLT